jgi:3-oxoacyl-[acyl-carrier protein] reductase
MDRYATFANSSVGRRVARRTGLPQPARLQRYAADQPDVAGPIDVGGTGSAADRVRQILPVDKAGPHRGLVFDATGLDDPGTLRELCAFFQPRLRDLLPNGRVVVLGTPPAQAKGVRAAAAQQALDGFVRSLGKELTRGGTANLLYLGPDCGDALDAPLKFLLSARSAYVSGQAITVGAAPAGKAATPAEPRVAAVTGAARGIGAAILRTLARAGATVVGIDVPAAGDALADTVNDVRGSALQLDLTRPDAPQRLVTHFTQRHGRLDVLVHNAGITRDRTLARMSEDEWNSVLAINLEAQLTVTDAVLAGTLMGDGGRIVAVSSVSGIAGNRGQTNYAASKAGVIGMVRALAPAVRERGITVNAVAPGLIETAMTAKMPAATRAVGRRMNSLGQGGLPVDVAEAVAFLAEPGAGGVTGTVLRVCGQSMIGA